VAPEREKPDRFAYLLVGTALVLTMGLGAFFAGAGDKGDWKSQRKRMVDQQIRSRGVKDAAVLAAMERVERHAFVPEQYRSESYADHPLPIGYDQTISQPYIVAYMTEALALKKGQKALEVGTGSGYQAAVLGQMGVEVYTIEIVEPLGKRAAEQLAQLGYKNVHVRVGDGYDGWPEHAPFDGVIVTAAPASIPQPLVDQLAEGGRMVIPVGRWVQDLKVMIKRGGKLKLIETLPVRFVPMTGKAGG
jgi:protein-L-isoaspartate(D-aspartate) O-methyltransferase